MSIVTRLFALVIAVLCAYAWFKSYELPGYVFHENGISRYSPFFPDQLLGFLTIIATLALAVFFLCGMVIGVGEAFGSKSSKAKPSTPKSKNRN